MSIFRDLGLQGSKERINEEVIYNIARAYSILDSALSQFLATYNLSLAKFNILLTVKHIGKDRGVSQQAISKSLLVTTSNITRMIDKLEKDEYVKRLDQEGDRRVNLIKITKKGSDLLDAIWPHYKEKIDSIIGHALLKEEKNKITSLLEKFTWHKKI